MKPTSITFSALMIGTLSMVGCQSSVSSKTSDPTPTQNLAGPDETLIDVTGTTALAIKNYDEIFNTMDQLTGLNIQRTTNPTQGTTELGGNANALMLFYSGNQASLPYTNSADLFDAAHGLTTFNLAYEFCAVLVDNAPERARFFSELFPFNLMNNDAMHSPSVILTSENKTKLVQYILDKFWVAVPKDSARRLEAEADLVQLINTTLDGSNMNQSATTRNVALTVCTTALGSGEIFLM